MRVQRRLSCVKVNDTFTKHRFILSTQRLWHLSRILPRPWWSIRPEWTDPLIRKVTTKWSGGGLYFFSNRLRTVPSTLVPLIHLSSAPPDDRFLALSNYLHFDITIPVFLQMECFFLGTGPLFPPWVGSLSHPILLSVEETVLNARPLLAHSSEDFLVSRYDCPLNLLLILLHSFPPPSLFSSSYKMPSPLYS